MRPSHAVKLSWLVLCLCVPTGLLLVATYARLSATSQWVVQQHAVADLAPLQRIQQLAAGEYHTCALTTSGGVLCWGDNRSGQLGDGTTVAKPMPTVVTGLSSGVKAITAGWYHTCALTTSGGVLCWGRNSSGQLGDGTTLDKLTPTAVMGLSSGLQAIAAGEYHTCAMTTSGGVLCWGDNRSGQLGDGSTLDKPTPTAVIGLSSSVHAIAVGGAHTCVLTIGSGILCWGHNVNGQLGDGTTVDKPTPIAVTWNQMW